MRSFIVVLILALAGCNDSSSTAVPDNDAAALAQIQALQNQVNGLQGQVDKFKELQLIGRPVGSPIAKPDQVTMFRAMGEPTLAPAAVTVTGQFGTCPNMGVQDGFTSNPITVSALAALSKAFKTCMGYNVEYVPGSGIVKTAPRIFWDGPNCTGNLLEWEAGGGGYDTETLKDGVVFSDPTNPSSILMVSAHQTPQSILIQSVFVTSNPVCQSDVETQLMYSVSQNNTQITGVPNLAIGQFTTGSP